ncbi:uncharacterized protein LOC105420558 [Amborella trichopoda]|uniref:uncharacterized protein LOC105420558 n=1 Tax=Amborella trichopoda TaxID=13333 RepID=UPI0005D2E267|nr:uncharacterized protein LOC105420558 [Amborella trichopoda]|eukprot:XP_011622918.1 uncharacterized protein LOC105420558 [Amborella trichopoda]
MELMGIGGTYRKWIQGCLSSAHFVVLVNGNANEFFRASRGILQGDLLSPFLLTLVAKAFSKMLQGAVDGGFIQGLPAWPNGIVLSHLQYADDALLFMKAINENIQNVWLFLKLYELISGARINRKKSKIIGINCLSSEMSYWASWLECEIETFPTKYFGLPLLNGSAPRSMWDPLIQRVVVKLDG